MPKGEFVSSAIMRKLILTTLSFLAMIPLWLVFFPLLVIFPTRAWRIRMAVLCCRYWSRFVLRINGIRWTVEGLEHFYTKPCVALFNHSTSLDFFVLAAMTPPYTLVFGKYELSRVPFLGWLWFFSGHPMIKRKNREHWMKILADVETQVTAGNFSTLIAPEGTRVRDMFLGPFKKGAFHMAMNAKAPLVPIVLHDARARETKTGLVPGPLRLQCLAPIPTDDWTAENLDEKIHEVRNLYLTTLGRDAEPFDPERLDQGTPFETSPNEDAKDPEASVAES